MNYENEELKKEVIPENALKDMLVDYVGNNNQNVLEDKVTVENIVETLSHEFPEFLLAIAEENFIRGYHQALSDVEEGEKLAAQET